MNTDVTATDEAIYPESDGKPMADNTLQWDWMVKIVGELRELFADREVFVAGDLFWYPVEGEPKIVTAPDALVVFGRPPGYRGSYKQWVEVNIAPQVVFEVLSPNNTASEMNAKLKWYEKYGVEEYYYLDPYDNLWMGWTRREGKLAQVETIQGFVSPRLGVRFDMKDGVRLFGPDGREFLTREERVEEISVELEKTAKAFEDERTRALNAIRHANEERERADEADLLADKAVQRADEADLLADEAVQRAAEATQRADEATQQAEQERQRAEQQQLAKERFAAKLRELGINPDDLLKPTG